MVSATTSHIFHLSIPYYFHTKREGSVPGAPKLDFLWIPFYFHMKRMKRAGSGPGASKLEFL